MSIRILRSLLAGRDQAAPDEVDRVGLTRMEELREVSLNAELLDMGMCKTVDDMDLQRRVLKGAHHHG